ncbi:endopeptidase La [Oceanithermus sp.]
MENTVLELPVIPLRNTVILPYANSPVDVGRARSKAAVEAATEGDRHVFLVTQKEPLVDDPKPDDLYPVGVLAAIKQVMRLPDGTMQVVIETKARARILEFSEEEGYTKAFAEIIADPPEFDGEMVRVLMRELKEAFERYVEAHKGLRLDRYKVEAVLGMADPLRLPDVVAGYTTWGVEDKIAVLETVGVEERLKKVLFMLLRDLERFSLDSKIAARVKEQMDANQREYYLREQMKAIQKELGGDDAAGEIEELRERIENRGMPEPVKEKALKELARLERMQPGSPEATVSRTYLDWLLDVPWTEASEDRIDIARTREILDEDHYGLEEVKERILEFLAVRQLADPGESYKGPILCLVGPPGVGKTSLGRSIARSMNREFVRISLGGVRDEAEIRGHRRTYIGALPGKIIQAMKNVGVVNPVFLLDEIDKMASDWRGDPASAMLEVLDPEQNKTFTDHYLDVPYDLSRVFFITTANSLSTIPGPLRDRMEIIEITGYTALEKEQIAKGFLWPRQLEAGRMQGRLAIENAAIRRVIHEYTREAGVRELERQLAKLVRRAAKRYIENPWEGERLVSEADLPDYLGVPKYRPDKREEAPQVGAAQGLAWTPVGGVLLTVEALAVPGKGNLKLTGNLGDVMKESAQAALSYLRATANRWGLPRDFHTQWDLHVHVPEGATPKDGPSAGITIAVAIASALTGRPARMDWAMTGEITLRGKVLAIGGLKEKLLAAHQSGIRQVILPAENEPQLAEVPEEVLRDLEIKLVEQVDEVLETVLLPVSEPTPPADKPSIRPEA